MPLRRHMQDEDGPINADITDATVLGSLPHLNTSPRTIISVSKSGFLNLEPFCQNRWVHGRSICKMHPHTLSVYISSIYTSPVRCSN